MCDRDIAINFGAVAGEVILVDSCAIIFICCDCFFFPEKTKKKKEEETEFLLAAVLFITAAVLFKTDFFCGIRYRPFVS